MSYILEALKKSEARRRDRQAPDLSQAPPETARRVGRWPLLVLTLLVVGAGSALGVWLATNRDADSPPMAGESNTDTLAATPSEQITTHVAIADRVRRATGKSASADTGRNEPALTAADTVTAAAAPVATAVTHGTGIDEGATVTPVTETARLTPGKAVTEAPAHDPPLAETATEALANADPRAEPAPATTQDVADSGTRSNPLDDLTALANERFEAAQAPDPEQPAGPPLIHQLTWSFRSQLPLLALNVHLYSEDPAQRFVLINMRRYEEGDVMENSGILIQRVVPEGVVLQLGGRDFLLGR